MMKLLMTLVITAVVTATATYWLTRQTFDFTDHEPADKPQKPLYWVAPMDPDYRRDGPGKSPMGMDLVPVFDDRDSSGASSRTSVMVSPAVVNNLGVRSATAQRRRWSDPVTTVGHVQFDEEQLLHVHPRVEGWVESLFVRAQGDAVRQGQPLYQLYSPQLINAQEELLLALSRNDPRLLEAAESRLKSLQIDDRLIAQLKLNGQVQQRPTFYSPIDGVVDELSIREGFYVRPDSHLFSIGKLDPIWVVAEVFERQAAGIEPGLPVAMSLDYLPAKVWSGRVDYVYPSLDEDSRTVRVRLRFANPDATLKPNMHVEVTIETAPGPEQLAVPAEAVIRTGQQDRVVLDLGEGHYKSVEVQLGRIGRHYAAIVDGLEEGDRVVTSAQFLLDSESSKNSDFKRIDTSNHEHHHSMEHQHD